MTENFFFKFVLFAVFFFKFGEDEIRTSGEILTELDLNHCPYFQESFFKGQPRPLFVYFRSFQAHILQKKATTGLEVEGEHADHLTTTTAHFP